MRKTREEVESENQRGQSISLHQVLELQAGKRKTETNGLVGFLRKEIHGIGKSGHKMDDETFITHLLNSLPHSEYEGAILVIKDKLRDVELSVIEKILDDKYQAMKHVEGWDEEEDDYALFTSQSNKKKPKKAFIGCCGFCGEFGHKAADCPNKKSNQIRAQRAKMSTKSNVVLKETLKERVIRICP